MKNICEALFKVKEILELALNLNDTRLRKIIQGLVKEMDKLVQECYENELN